jgi:hypothetical protein
LNVLSIDIDYAYSPTISIYEDYVEGSRISLLEQMDIFKENNLPMPRLNKKKLKLLKSVMREKTNLDTPIVIAEHHHQIVPFLPKDEPFNIFNFDHHHDVYYEGWHSIDELDEGNWVYFLQDNPIIKYTWFRNKDSEDFPKDMSLKFETEEVYDFDLDDLPNFDLVFGCSSCHWTGNLGRKNLFKVLGVKT